MGLSRFSVLIIAVLAGVGSTSCNLLGFLDVPNTEAQYLSRARACLDKADYVCALEYYQKLSDNVIDIRESELAFLELDQNGADIGTFIRSMRNGGGAPSINLMANALASGAGETRRLAFYEAYMRIASISSMELRGLVRLIAATALLAELLAESAVDVQFDQADLVTDNAACYAGGGPPTCDGTTICILNGTGPGTGPAIDIRNEAALPALATFSGGFHYGMIGATIQAIDYAFNNEINAGGLFGDSGALMSQLVASLAALDTTMVADCGCFASVLIVNDLGAP